jgi:hypothetical protein
VAIYHVAHHGYKQAPTAEEMAAQLAMFTAGFEAAPYVKEFFVGRYAGNPADGYHDAACLKFVDLDAYRAHMQAPHGPDEATHLREKVARVRSFDILTAEEPADTAEKIIEFYKMRWEMFPEVAAALRNDVNADFPYL